MRHVFAMRLYGNSVMMFPITLLSYRRYGCGKIRMGFLVISALAALMCCMFVLPVRNVVFHSALKYAWLEIPTSSLLRIHFSNEVVPEGVYQKVACFEKRSPKVSKANVSSSMPVPYSPVENANLTMEVLRRGHGKFLPFLDSQQKLDILFLYSVLSETLAAVKVEHFLVGGSLLGLTRHAGIVPWDDDLDIAVSFRHIDIVKQTLSCIQGFNLTIRPQLHWKFHYAGDMNPFVDIFMYQMDESYVWSLTDYIRNTFIYPTEYVFPLSTGVFEGLRVPIPGKALAIARRIYDYDKCTAYPNHVERKDTSLREQHPCGFVVTSLECKELSYLYTMYHLHDSLIQV